MVLASAFVSSAVSPLNVNNFWLASTVVTLLFVILYPLALAIFVNRRLHVGWRYFGFGALVFFVFQVITRVPLVTALGVVLAPQLKASLPFRYTWLLILVVTAGIFEEVGRYVGYRVLMRRDEKTWRKAIMYGVGHGGLESMLLIGGSLLLTLINVLTISAIGLNGLPASSRATVIRQFATLNAEPGWLPLLGAWERLWTIPVHIALSVIVLQVFRRRNLGWLWLAILAHALVDGVAVFIPQFLGSSVGVTLLVEGIIAVFGLIALWVIWALRDRPQDDTIGAALQPPERSLSAQAAVGR